MLKRLNSNTSSHGCQCSHVWECHTAEQYLSLTRLNSEMFDAAAKDLHTAEQYQSSLTRLNSVISWHGSTVVFSFDTAEQLLWKTSHPAEYFFTRLILHTSEIPSHGWINTWWKFLTRLKLLLKRLNSMSSHFSTVIFRNFSKTFSLVSAD